MSYRRIVVKLGTNLLTGGTSSLDLGVMGRLVEQVIALRKQGPEVIVVSSGAIACGRHQLGLKRERKDIPFRQVLASVGQGRLMHTYDQLFSRHKVTVAQTLLTKADISDRLGYLNARNTLLALLDLGVVPIVNENDVVSVDEIKEASFGDNDNLSAMVANLVDADLLMLLTDTAGLYTADPSRDADARLVRRVDKIDSVIENMARGPAGEGGTGGMITKIEAAKLATVSGVAVVIANGREPDVVLRLAEGEQIGTLFPATTSKLESRKRWMLSRLSARGKLFVDEGAVVALREQNKSLLPAGVVGVEDDFERGDVVNIVDGAGKGVACGISNYSAEDVAVIKGARSDRILKLLGYEYGAEVVHRNNLALL